MDKKHKEFQLEREKLYQTIQTVTESIQMAEEYRSFIREDTKQAFIEYDYRDSNQSYDKIALNAVLYEMLLKDYDGLLRAKEKPYFCRIDFQHDKRDITEQIYIGKMGLTDPNVGSPTVVDWRAPIASVYYEGRLGDVSYISPEGTKKGFLHLKRQYTIKNSELEQIMDVDITTSDDFLQTALGEVKDNKLKDIVATIQQEQNAIIRAPLKRPLIIQGVAGSGKTTIALHRIAYLIYTYEGSFSPQDFLIIAPNRLFMDYISNVLPELGADKVRQTTFADLVFSNIKLKNKPTDTNQTLMSLISPELTDAKRRQIIQCSKWKGSLAFLSVLEKYLQAIQESIYPKVDFTVDGYFITSASEIQELMESTEFHVPLLGRIKNIKKILAFRLKNKQKEILDQIEKDFEQRKDRLRGSMPPSDERKQAMRAIIDEQDSTLESIKKKLKTAVNTYMKQFPKLDSFTLYQKLITDANRIQHYAQGALDETSAQYIASHSAQVLQGKKLDPEDLAPIIFLQHRILGLPDEFTARYVVVDEAQDFSLLQFAVLKQVLGTRMFTILGDLAQGIHEYRGISDWNELREGVFLEDDCEYRTLQQSYRTTIEIMEFANKVIAKCRKGNPLHAKPVVRHGAPVKIHRINDSETLIVAVKQHVNNMQALKYESIALICKTDDECTFVNKALAKLGLICHQLSDKDERYDAGVVIVPAYLAKGLEFDAVAIVSLKTDYHETDLDIKLLYVAMTRALHHLDVFCKSTQLSILDHE